MPIRYALLENNISGGLDDNAAVMQMMDGTDLDALVRRVIEHTRASILAVRDDAIGRYATWRLRITNA